VICEAALALDGLAETYCARERIKVPFHYTAVRIGLGLVMTPHFRGRGGGGVHWF